MTDVTRILSAIGQGDPRAAEELLPLVYDELRKLAAQKLAQEKPGQTLQATALVHEAYLRLVEAQVGQNWDGRGHFFAAAAEAMRRILIENARRKKRTKRGGDRKRIELDDPRLSYTEPVEELIAIDQALEQLALDDPQAAQLLKLRFFAGLSIEHAAELVGFSRSTASRAEFLGSGRGVQPRRQTRRLGECQAQMVRKNVSNAAGGREDKEMRAAFSPLFPKSQIRNPKPRAAANLDLDARFGGLIRFRGCRRPTKNTIPATAAISLIDFRNRR